MIWFFELILIGPLLGLISLTQKPSHIRIFLACCLSLYIVAYASIPALDQMARSSPQLQHDWGGWPFESGPWIKEAGLQAIALFAIAFATRLAVRAYGKCKPTP
jgi:hypothetical protein